MTNFDWNSYFEQHPIFSDLTKAEVQTLLNDEVSKEREFERDQVIIREGEPTDSLFLIGSGAVSVLHEEKGQKILLSTLYKGDFFGEMALFEKRPRSATVTADEPCMLLVIKGQEFLNLLRAHPNIEIKVFAKLSERLRHVGEKLLSLRLTNVDEKLKEFDTKLEFQLRIYEEKLKATEALFDQTKLRANEIIDSADRSRTRMAAIGSAVVMLITVGGGLGIFNVMNKIGDMDTKFEEVRTKMANKVAALDDTIREATTQLSVTIREATTQLSEITVLGKDIEKRANDLDFSIKSVGQYEEDVRNASADNLRIQTALFNHIVLPKFWEKFKGLEKDNKSIDPETLSLYRILLETQNNTISVNLINEFVYKLVNDNPGKRARVKDLLWLGNHEEEQPWDQLPNHKVVSYFLVLAFSILDNEYGNSKFNKEFSFFEKSVQEQFGMEITETYMTMLDEFFSEQNNKKYLEAYKQLKDAIPTG